MGNEVESLIISIVIFGTLTLLLFVAALVYMVMFYRRKVIIHQLEQELMLQRHRQELQRQETEAQELERARIGRDLHDEIGSALVTTNTCLTNIGKGLSGAEQERIDQITNHLSNTIDGLQRIVSELTPPSLDLMHPSEAIQLHCELVMQATDIQIEVDVDLKPPILLNISDQIAVFRTVQEIITNAVKHAQCKAMNIVWEESDTCVTIQVFDNGIGFEPEKMHHGHGLRNMHNRISLCGGTLKIDSAPEKGTRHNIHIPIANHPKTANQ
jgi:two-component system, NarL family, sensor kinase